MLNERQKNFVRRYAGKATSLEGLGKLLKNPTLPYKVLKSFICDVNLRDMSLAEDRRIYKESIVALGQIANVMSDDGTAPTLKDWLPAGSPAADTSALGELLEKYGSDKSTLHNYHEIYGAVLGARREQALKILEIGMGTNNLDVPSNMGLWGKPGASLRAFRDWAPNASIHGADVAQRILFQEDRISTHFVDQTNEDTLKQLVGRLSGCKFDLIIDDGLHLPHANLNTLHAFLGLLADHGVFVIEDIDPQYRDFWRIAEATLSAKYDTCYSMTRSACVFMVRHKLGRSPGG